LPLCPVWSQLVQSWPNKERMKCEAW
jgi:hypothetical protein